MFRKNTFLILTTALLSVSSCVKASMGFNERDLDVLNQSARAMNGLNVLCHTNSSLEKSFLYDEGNGARVPEVPLIHHYHPLLGVEYVLKLEKNDSVFFMVIQKYDNQGFQGKQPSMLFRPHYYIHRDHLSKDEVRDYVCTKKLKDFVGPGKSNKATSGLKMHAIDYAIGRKKPLVGSFSTHVDGEKKQYIASPSTSGVICPSIQSSVAFFQTHIKRAGDIPETTTMHALLGSREAHQFNKDLQGLGDKSFAGVMSLLRQTAQQYKAKGTDLFFDDLDEYLSVSAPVPSQMSGPIADLVTLESLTAAVGRSGKTAKPEVDKLLMTLVANGRTNKETVFNYISVQNYGPSFDLMTNDSLRKAVLRLLSDKEKQTNEDYVGAIKKLIAVKRTTLLVSKLSYEYLDGKGLLGNNF